MDSAPICRRCGTRRPKFRKETAKLGNSMKKVVYKKKIAEKSCDGSLLSIGFCAKNREKEAAASRILIRQSDSSFFLLSECRRWDLNPHGIATTGT